MALKAGMEAMCRFRILTIFLALLSAGNFSAEASAFKVLVLHSYHEGYAWTDAIERGIHQGFEGKEVTIETFYMDTKRHSDEISKQAAGQKAREKMAAFDPDVVITSDDDAQQYFARDLTGKERPKVVFCGVNAEAGAYGFPAANVTGVLERNKVAAGAALLKEIVPSVARLAVITDDSSASSAMIQYIKGEKMPLEVVAYKQASDFEGWKQMVLQEEQEADALAILLYHTVRKAPGGEVMASSEVMHWTAANSTKPMIGVFDFAMEEGALCGIAESGEEHGMEAAHMAAEILNGKPAGEIPVRIAQSGKVMLNLVTAEHLGIMPAYEIIEVCDRVIQREEHTGEQP